MEKARPKYQDAECEEEKQPPCTKRASALLEKLVRMREVLGHIEGTTADQSIDEDAGSGSLPLLELQLNMANRDAEEILARLNNLAARI